MSQRVLPTGFIPPCIPTKAPQPPTGALWLHEIKHDGFRIIARKLRVALQPPRQQPDRAVSAHRRGIARPPIALLHYRRRGVYCDVKGVPSFERILYRRHDGSVFLYAFDLIELDGDDCGASRL